MGLLKLAIKAALLPKLEQKFAVRVEHLYPMIVAICDKHSARLANRNLIRGVEQPVRASGTAKLRHKLSIQVEDLHAVPIAINSVQTVVRTDCKPPGTHKLSVSTTLGTKAFYEIVSLIKLADLVIIVIANVDVSVSINRDAMGGAKLGTPVLVLPSKLFRQIPSILRHPLGLSPIRQQRA